MCGRGGSEHLRGDRARETADRLSAAGIDQMRVPARGVEVRVAQEVTDRAEIGSHRESEGRGGVTQGVRGDPLGGPHHTPEMDEPVFHRPDRQAGASLRDEERLLVGQDACGALSKPGAHEHRGGDVEGEIVDRPALSVDSEERCG